MRLQTKSNFIISFQKYLYLIFVVFCVSYISTLQYRPYSFSYIVKIIPILALSLIPLLNISGNKGKFIFTGLIFSALGDLLLAMEGNKFLIFGLGAFGFALLMYILAFLRNVVLRRKRSILLFVFIIYGLAIGYLITPNLGKMLIPVLIYLSLLIFLGISSVIGKDNNFLLIPGALLFMISDSIIGINSFLIKIPNSSFWIMLTYFQAQFLIVLGSSIKKNNN